MQAVDFPAEDFVTLPPEGNENLPLGDTTKSFIREEIKTQLGQAIDKFNPHGWRRVANFIREWGLAGTLVMAPIALLGLIGAGWYYALNRVDKEARFQTTTDNRLKAIEDQLKGIRGDLAKQSMINHAALPLADFRATLPDLRAAIATARKQNVVVPSKVVSNLQQKMVAALGAGASAATDKEAPGFWPTAAEFISYRSSSSAPALPPNLPDCTDRDPKGSTITDNSKLNANPPQFSFSASIYEDCRLTLDSQKDSDKINTLLVTNALSIQFKHCLIVYRGGAVNLIIAKSNVPVVIRAGRNLNRPTMIASGPFSGPTLSFEDCVFDFKFDITPPIKGQKITETLLAQNGPSLNLAMDKSSTH